MSETKQLYLYGHEYAEDGTCIYITVNPIEARAIINQLITCLEEGHTPNFVVYGQLQTVEDHLGPEGGES